MPVIPPFLVNIKLMTDFKTKANIFNHFFSKQCTPLANSGKQPEDQAYLKNSRISSVRGKQPEDQVYLKNSRISSVPFSDNLVINIIRNLNVNKAHSHDDISIRMIKICDESLVKPLSIKFFEFLHLPKHLQKSKRNTNS